jgi:hypothetical protein
MEHLLDACLGVLSRPRPSSLDQAVVFDLPSFIAVQLMVARASQRIFQGDAFQEHKKHNRSAVAARRIADCGCGLMPCETQVLEMGFGVALEMVEDGGDEVR